MTLLTPLFSSRISLILERKTTVFNCVHYTCNGNLTVNNILGSIQKQFSCFKVLNQYSQYLYIRHTLIWKALIAENFEVHYITLFH